MTQRLLLVSAAALLCAGLPHRVEAAAWVRVETPNFVVYGETGEKRTRDVAAEFERFREALGRVLPGAAKRAAVPTTVVVFETRRSLAPFRPLYNGKPVDIAGYFASENDMNHVVLTIEQREEALRTVFHEYVHLVASNLGQGLPLWLNEGLAEYYSTFLVKDDGRSATLGAVVPSHIRLLNEDPLLPLADLLGVVHGSRLYNEGERRGMFYAQSWALVHFLIAGEPSRTKELARYLEATTAGVAPLAAWQQAFGNYDPNPDLRRYVQQFSVRGFIYRFTAGIERVQGEVRPVSGGDLEAVLGDTLNAVQRAGEAEARLLKSVTVEPPSARGRALLGQARVRAGQYEEARRLLLEAASERSDWLVQYLVASGLTDMMGREHTPEALAAADTAAAALAAVLAVRPELPHALAMQAIVSLTTGTDLAGALAGVQRARALAPGRSDYASLEAMVHIQEGRYAAAREILGPLMSNRYPEHVRDHARRLMGQAVTLERAAATRTAPGTNPSPATDAPTIRPEYRVVKTGEERLEGLLERIACTAAGGIVMELRSDTGLQRFTAAKFDAIEFLTYRPDLRDGIITCGQRVPPDHVYLTWQPAAPPATGPNAPAGRVVAVEFLPK